MHNSTKLLLNSIVKLLSGLVMIAILLFLPAGTWHYLHAWLFIALLFVPMTMIGIWLYLSQPNLLAKRLGNKEREQQQKNVVALSGLVITS